MFSVVRQRKRSSEVTPFAAFRVWRMVTYAVAVVMLACSTPARDHAAAGEPAALVDDFGDTLHLAHAAQRVVSLNPVTTEAMFAIGSTPGKKIGLGLEIPESGSSYRRPGMGGRGGMGGGMRGGRGGMMGGRMGGRGGAGLQNFKIWADVKLAASAGRVSAARPSLSSRPQPD